MAHLGGGAEAHARFKQYDYDQVQEESEDWDDGPESNGAGAMQMGGLDDEDMEEANEGLTINVQDIDAYWLQRRISQAFQGIDPEQSQKLAEEVLKILAEGEDRDVENQLVMLLDYDKFDLIKLLLRNRLKIVWCTRLARAEDQDQRKKKIEEDMLARGQTLSAILEQLHATRASAKERQKNLEKIIREEARRLKDEHGGEDY